MLHRLRASQPEMNIRETQYEQEMNSMNIP